MGTSVLVAVIAFGLALGANSQASDADGWLGSQEGISDEVLAPWTPVRVKGKREKTVSVWGREYEFDGLPFPSRINIRGTDILAGPIRLVAVVDGAEQEWTERGTPVLNAAPAVAHLAPIARADASYVDSNAIVEYDGMIRSEIALAEDGGKSLDSLTLEIPIKREHAKYLYHYPGKWGSAYNAGALPAEGFTNPFKPYVWLGDEDLGLAWFCESDEGFFPLDRDDVIDIREEGDAVVLRIRIIAEPVDLDESRNYVFGFQATPVKPVVEDVWDMRIVHHGGYGIDTQQAPSNAWFEYPAEGNIDLAEGTFEAWVRPRFDTDPPITREDGNRGSYNQELLRVNFPGGDVIGFYWNIDDRGMRAYIKKGSQHPMVVGGPSRLERDTWHHVALTWGDEVRVYVDGELTVSQAWSGTLPHALTDARIHLGSGKAQFDVGEVRISDVARTSFDISAQPIAGARTLLLDHLDEDSTLADKSDSSVHVDGKFGEALTLYEPGPTQTIIDRLAELGVRTIVFHEHWTDIQNYTSTTHGDDLRKLVAACHERGMKVLLYFGYEISTIAPEWDEWAEKCLIAPRHGAYTRQPTQTAYTVCYESAWQDFMAAGMARMMDEYDIDGAYLDGTANPWGCSNTLHGCGYEAPDGSLRPTYSIAGAREMMRRIYTLVRSRKPDGLVNVHQSTCMTIPTLAWATSYWDGEQFGGIAPGASALEVLPLDTFRT
ncbi:MAG TPA: DUF6067 family protein, partial [Armatimonadota bacterium]|nr:DUF6067 family protein [Armatimonadota bacterium]